MHYDMRNEPLKTLNAMFWAYVDAEGLDREDLPQPLIDVFYQLADAFVSVD